MNKHFWKGRKVLITGFEGFLGSNLTKALLYSGAKIYGLDIKVRRKDTILAAADYKKITVIKGSVADYKLVKNIIRRNKINVVFHLAAEAIVGKCHNDPLCTFSTNIQGTWNILEACRGLKNIRAVVIASSDKAYGSHKKLPYTEKTPLQGNHPYDVSKSCADLIANTYAYTYGLPVCVTRCGNIFGPGDFNFSRLVPDAVICALTCKKLLIRSDGLFTRDYVFVEDIVNGYILLAEKICKLNLSGECFNFSCERPVTVIKLVKMISKAIGKPADYKILNQIKYEIRHQYLSSRKARAKLGWRPVFSLDTGLKNTIGWYKKVF
ncbi:MAG: GDP-mannose 4,6-dehydratase [Candidatus Omnitrophica bacterium]|nr:GDP-mannose 4,6-dehydratase [Candidatus Omnitrophota bacterium]